MIVNSQLPAAEQFEKWVFEDVLPTIRKTGRYYAKPAKPPTPLKQLSEATKAFKAVYQLMRTLELDKNAAIIHANQAIRKETGKDVLALLDRTHLKADNPSSLHYNPTELGQQLGGLSPRKVNALLEAARLQERIGTEWQPTPTSRPHAFISDTGKRHGSGAPIQQVR